jgi:uncharacterized membrane protein YkoI
MKKAILVIGLVFAAVTTIGFTSEDQDKVPQAVKDAFAQKFPTAEKVDWDKESATEWEAEFKMNTLEYSANFLEDGTWKETEHEIDEAEIPQVVITALRSNFPGYEIEETEMAETPQGTVYEFEIENGKTEMEVAIDPNGKVLKKQME